MNQECRFEVTSNAEICPLQIPTYLPQHASIDDLKDFFTGFVERDLWELTNVSSGQIVRVLDDPSFQSGSFDEKCNAVTDLFVQGLIDKRESILNQ